MTYNGFVIRYSKKPVEVLGGMESICETVISDKASHYNIKNAIKARLQDDIFEDPIFKRMKGETGYIIHASEKVDLKRVNLMPETTTWICYSIVKYKEKNN